MKKMKSLSIILFVLLFAFPVLGRDFGQEKNNFKGVQYFEAGVIFGTEADSLDTLTYVSNDTTMTDADSKALVTEYAVKKYADMKVSLADLDSLLIVMKGYQEYTFSIRQDSTDAPTILVSHDDFNLVTPITFIRGSEGTYIGDISPLGLTLGPDVNLFVSAAQTNTTDICVYMPNANQLMIETRVKSTGDKSDDGLSDVIGLTISIQKTLF